MTQKAEDKCYLATNGLGAGHCTRSQDLELRGTPEITPPPPHFTEEETEAKRDEIIYTRSYGQ